MRLHELQQHRWVDFSRVIRKPVALNEPVPIQNGAQGEAIVKAHALIQQTARRQNLFGDPFKQVTQQQTTGQALGSCKYNGCA